MKCWYGALLNKISEKFLYENLHTETGMVRVQGVPSSVCDYPTTEHTGLVTVVGQFMYLNQASAASATTAFGAGVNVEPGFIKWDPEDGTVPEGL